MLNNNEITPVKIRDHLICNFEKRKRYVKPCLQEMGDLRTLTLGASPGSLESGGGGTRDFSLGGDSWPPPLE